MTVPMKVCYLPSLRRWRWSAVLAFSALWQVSMAHAEVDGASLLHPGPVVTHTEMVPAPSSPAVGEATRKLLALQASGASASNQRYAMPEAVAQQVYERYLKSFSHPIPEHSLSALDKKR